MLGTTRQGMTTMARRSVCVERPLASWARWRAEAQWDLRGVSQTLARWLVPPLGARRPLWDALWAAVETPLMPTVRGKMPGVQKWHDHSGTPARGELWVGHHWALIGVVATWGAGERCGPLLARWLPGQLNALGCVAGREGMRRLDFGAVVVSLVREWPPDVGNRPWCGVADAYVSQAAFLPPLGGGDHGAEPAAPRGGGLG